MKLLSNMKLLQLSKKNLKINDFWRMSQTLILIILLNF